MKFRIALIIAIMTALSCVSSMPEYFKLKNSVPVDHTASQTVLSGENAIRKLKEDGDYESLGAAVTSARYSAEASGETALAENHANRMRAAFSPAGLVIESDDPSAKWQSRWRLQNLDRGDQRMTISS